jgi:outer membrane biosynthesis protein TonB
MARTARNLEEDGDMSGRAQVTLKVSVLANGTVETVEIGERNVSRRLADSVRREAKLCRFVPTERGGTPVPSATQLVVRIEKQDYFVVAGGLRCPFSRLPPQSAMTATTVEIVVRVHLGAAGVPSRTEVLKSSAGPIVDEVAAQDAAKCRWVGSESTTGSAPSAVDFQYQWRK